MLNENRVNSNITIEDAKLIFRNFSGNKTEFNEEGNRNFGVILDDDLAEVLKRDGWNVKYLKPRKDDPDEYRQPWLPVKVKFGKFPPIVQLVTSKGRVKLDEQTIGQIDWFEWDSIERADLIIRPYNYPAIAGRNAGVSAYLKTLYVKIYEDEITRRYNEIPEV